ncbi:RecQ family ATP-dependent DNA helicase [Rubritalea tangerina]|uniref:ATP-dependent DNA helicase RecQ n=1 Tax=Rubritalea tangerina TaxID=430798 RepID=A0ABW4ZBP7_9BACT
MSDLLEPTLLSHFGHASFRPLQREIIESTLSGAPTLAILPTGGGKSLTYQLPALLLEGVSIVISPLLSLIEDQVTELQRKNIAAARYDSTQSLTQRAETIEKLKKREIKLLYTSPESLASTTLVTALKHIDIALVAIDEAHCITEWGHTFRPSYLYLPKIIRQLKPHATLALTATATKKTAFEIRKYFKIKTAHQFTSSHTRPNLTFQVTPLTPEDKTAALLSTLASPDTLPAIVYAMRQEQCEQIAHTLSQNGYQARSYHAGMSNPARSQVQHDFLHDKIQIVVATIAFGMGVDKPNIRSVVHYHLPKSPEGWMQEAGRAGRDRKPSTCTLLACGDDTIPLENFIHTKLLRKNTLSRFLESLFSQGKHIEFSPYHTRLLHDFHVSTLDIILARLEVTHYLQFKGTSWRYIRAWIPTGQSLTLDHFPKKTQKAINHILTLGERYDTNRSQDDFGISRPTLWNALDQLASSIVFKPSGWLWHYTIKKQPPHLETLVDSLHETFHAQYQHDLEKLHHLTKISLTRGCIPKALAHWFGERDAPNCGKCSACLNLKVPRRLPNSAPSEPSPQEQEMIHQLTTNPRHHFKTNQQLARFLCGIASPYLRHYKLHFHQHFGLLKHLPYTDVFAYAKASLNARD